MFLIVLESMVSRVIEMDIYCSSYRRMERELQTEGKGDVDYSLDLPLALL